MTRGTIGRMRNTAAMDDATEKPADELAGPSVKGDLEDLDTSGWDDESGDGDTPGPDRKPAKKTARKGKTRKAVIK